MNLRTTAQVALAWLGLAVLGAGFALVMTFALTCAPWTVAWREFAGPTSAPACPYIN